MSRYLEETEGAKSPDLDESLESDDNNASDGSIDAIEFGDLQEVLSRANQKSSNQKSSNQKSSKRFVPPSLMVFE